jgi:hypothetical protein
MVKVEVDIPDIKGIISTWDISVRVVKRGPSLRLTARKSIGEWERI